MESMDSNIRQSRLKCYSAIGYDYSPNASIAMAAKSLLRKILKQNKEHQSTRAGRNDIPRAYSLAKSSLPDLSDFDLKSYHARFLY